MNFIFKKTNQDENEFLDKDDEDGAAYLNNELLDEIYTEPKNLKKPSNLVRKFFFH